MKLALPRAPRFRLVLGGLFALVLGSTPAVAASPGLIPTGAAKVDVTPTQPVVLAGYGGRSKEYEGIDSKLWARALVIGDREPVAIVVLDNCGVPVGVVEEVARRLAPHGISRERLVVAATHTHNAPSLVGYATILWAGRTTPEQDKRTAEYTELATSKMVEAVVAAIKNRKSMRLEWVQGRVNFGGNRRVMRNGQWAGFGFQRNAPVDHSLPVLAARDGDGTVRAVWANYACHCTTVGSRNHLGGDWAGFANEAMEEAFPDAVALMSIGCGADIGPQPSGNLGIAAEHGKSIATEVARLLADQSKRKRTNLTKPPVAKVKEISLPLEKPKPRAYWEALATRDGFHAELGKAMLHKIEEKGAIPAAVDYRVTSWAFGNELAMVFLPGEVVVDYSVRLNRELDWSRLWVTAWSNGMPGYIPSRRILAEGGYEAEFSQIYYGQPGRYDPKVEDLLVETVREVAGKSFAAQEDQEPAPFHRLPSNAPEAFRRVSDWARAAAAGDGEEKKMLQQVRELSARALPAFRKIEKHDGETTDWYDFAGDYTSRLFIRQERKGAELAWTSPPIPTEIKAGDSLVLCFLGGLGWVSQPATDGFALFVGGKEVLRFDVTRKPGRWQSEDRSVELVYLPTWTSAEDSAGFFFIRMSRLPVSSGEGIALGGRSLGHGSKRWFGIDARQDLATRLKELQAALRGE